VSSNAFVNRVFREYYASEADKLTAPSLVGEREFGFISFENVMVRHRAFESEGDMRAFLKDFVPSDAYYSCAYYEDPRADMERKGWQGADLIFDIDADHIPTPCDKVHDEWVCGSCKFSGKGVPPDICPACGKEKFEVSTWPCEVCLKSAKEETIKLLDMLVHDFSFSKSEVHVFFSGHRGYHVHVESEAVQTLDAIARKEIVDYLTGLGLNLALHGLDEKTWRALQSSGFLHLRDFGWRKRITEGSRKFIQSAEEEDFRKLGFDKDAIEAILRSRDSIVKKLDNGIWTTVKGFSFGSWKKIAEHVMRLNSAKIDTVVTTDIHRLIRLTGTLHGKTGFKKVEFPASVIHKFDPFKEGIALKKGTVRVFVSSAPAFRIGDEMFGPYENREIDLPVAAAVLLICKERAKVVE
jgi:DNA primase small subunit